jgi:oligosaccharide repeat unit polymerase
MDSLNDISVIPACLFAALLGYAIWADVRHDLCRLVSGRNMVLFGIGVWYLLEAIMLPALLRTYTQEQYNFGVLCITLALAGFLLGYHHTSGCSVFPVLGEKLTLFDDQTWLWRLVLFGAVIGFAPVVYVTGTQFSEMFEGMMGMRVTWGGVLGRGRYGDARAAFLELERFVGAVAPFAAILLVSRGSTVVQRLFCALVIAWPAIRAFGTGTRSSLIPSVGSLLAVFFWKATPAWRKKMIYAALFSAPFVYWLMAAIVVSRGTGAFAWQDREKAAYVGNEMFRELLFINKKVPAELPHQWGYSYYVQLVNPIPRFLWPDKPTMDAGLLLAKAYGIVTESGVAYLSVSPGLIGEMYLEFGVVGILVLSFFGGWLVKGWDLILRYYSQSLAAMVYYSAGLAVLLMMGRGFSMAALYGLLGLALLAWFIRYLNPHAASEAFAIRAVPSQGQ